MNTRPATRKGGRDRLKQDSRYDAMSEDEREKYYMKPSLMTKIKKALRGQ